MSRSHLAACPCCARHVRVSESACPFCRSALRDAFPATPTREPREPRARLTRAALFALGAGVVLTPACSSKSSGSTVLPGYGLAPFDDASVETPNDGGG